MRALLHRTRRVLATAGAALFISTLPNAAVAQAPATGSDEATAGLGCGRDLGDDIAALVNGAPLLLADFKVGTDGITDPALTAALGVANAGRRAANGLAVPSEIESALARQIRDNPCFRSFERAVRQGEAEQSGAGRAVLQIQMPRAKTYDLTVEYQPGKFRRSVLLELSFGLELRDPQGKVVFARASGDSYRRICTREGDADCLDAFRAPLDLATEWRELLRREITALLAGAQTELAAWRALLEASSGAFYDRSYSAEINTTGRAVRSREALALPYLFVQTPVPPVAIGKLVEGLAASGMAMDAAAKSELQNHYNVVFRSQLDRSLREAIDASSDVEDARIVLLSDAQSEAFRAALAAACADQSRGFERTEDCLAPVDLIDRLCKPESEQTRKAPNPRGDRCLHSSLVYNAPGMSKGERSSNAYWAVQQIRAMSLLRPADGQWERLRCSGERPDDAFPSLVGTSDRYLRFDGEAQNDDGLYVLEAAVRVMSGQTDCIAQKLVEQYKSLDE